MANGESQVLSIAHRFVEEFWGKGNMSLAEELLSETVQVITGLKPDGPIDGIAEYKQVFSGFYDTFPPIQPLRIEDSFSTIDRAVVHFKSLQK
ncbi:MAG: nuclear transport factor 2 family protein [Leptolyngbyaceae cyanobacterium bins.59]|nr:nuclear transport factor 2 family protein [Leptolyngbyaceae cyanobacterium bins.59]